MAGMPNLLKYPAAIASGAVAGALIWGYYPFPNDYEAALATQLDQAVTGSPFDRSQFTLERVDSPATPGVARFALDTMLATAGEKHPADNPADKLQAETSCGLADANGLLPPEAVQDWSAAKQEDAKSSPNQNRLTELYRHAALICTGAVIQANTPLTVPTNLS